MVDSNFRASAEQPKSIGNAQTHRVIYGDGLLLFTILGASSQIGLHSSRRGIRTDQFPCSPNLDKNSRPCVGEQRRRRYLIVNADGKRRTVAAGTMNADMTQTQKRPPRVFPLHLTPFESYMLLDDRPAHPMTFIVQISFSGNLDRQAFADSIPQAISRHPLLRAIVKPKKQKRDCWVDAKQELTVDYGALEEPLTFQTGEFIDLRREIGVRMWVRHNADGGVLTVQFHHSVCDGIGSYQFLGDVFWFYAKQTDATDLPDLPELDARELRNRLRANYKHEHFQLSEDEFQNEWMNSARMMLTQVNRLRQSEIAPDSTSTPFPGIESVTFDKAWYRKFRKAAQSLSLISNDLLLEKMFVALSKWNRKNGGLGRGSMCVMVPLDLREKMGGTMPATNIVTYAFIRAKQVLVRKIPELRSRLREEMTYVKQTRHTSRFTNMIVGSIKYPRIAKFVLRSPKCLATATLSNTGDPSRRFHVEFPKENGKLRCGNIALTDFGGVPPMRHYTRATTSIFTYGRGLKICMRCDPRLFRPADTRALLEMYADELRAVVGE
ncbi:condensation domain-containing protein [Planctomycetota bacterium]